MSEHVYIVTAKPQDLTPGKTITQLVAEVHTWARTKGWARELASVPCGHIATVDGEHSTVEFEEPVELDVDGVLAKLALIHSEVSEGVEAVREGHTGIVHIDGKPEGLTVELADVCIRIFQLAGVLELPLEAAITLKMAYNEKRPFRHGGKLA